MIYSCSTIGPQLKVTQISHCSVSVSWEDFINSMTLHHITTTTTATSPTQDDSITAKTTTTPSPRQVTSTKTNLLKAIINVYQLFKQENDKIFLKGVFHLKKNYTIRLINYFAIKTVLN